MTGIFETPELWRAAIVLIGVTAAAVVDFRTGYIYDWLTYPLIALGVLFSLLAFDALALAFGVGVFLFGYLLYYLGAIGGGDVKLFTGVAFLLPFYQGQLFLLNALFLAAAASVVFWSVRYTLGYVRGGIDWNENKSTLKQAGMLGAFLVIYLALAMFLNMPLTNPTLPVFVGLVIIALPYIAFRNGINKRFLLKEVSLDKLEEDEVVARPFMPKKTADALGDRFKGVLSEDDVEKLKKCGIKTVPVYRGLPRFGPFFLAGVLLAFAFPDFLSLLFFVPAF